MKKPAFCLIICFLGIIAGAEAQESVSGRHDIGQLINEAEKTYELSKEEVVVLFDGLIYHWLPDSRRIKFVHQIIMINSEIAVREFNEIRIPVDRERCTIYDVTFRIRH